MTGLLSVTAVLVLIALIAPAFGTDSRDGQDWRYRPGSLRPAELPARRRSIRADLVVLGRRVRCVMRAPARLCRAQERAWAACWRAHRPWRDDRLRWRAVSGTWRLEGRVAPTGPVPAEQSPEPGSEPASESPGGSSEPTEDRRGLGLDSPG